MVWWKICKPDELKQGKEEVGEGKSWESSGIGQEDE